MNRNLRKIISVVLCALLLIPATAAVTALAADNNLPIVYVQGYGNGIYNAEGKKIAPVDEPEGYFSEALSDCVGPFVKAILSNDPADIAAYKEKLIGWIEPLYADARMNDDGTPHEGDYADRPDDPTRNYGTYTIRNYVFCYDWRMDPWDNAELLNDYIETILRTTGKSKVNLVGRCEGATIAMAYLARYGHEKVSKIFFNTSAVNGVLLSSKLFSGHVVFNATAADQWLKTNEEVELPEGEIIDFLLSIISLAGNTYGLDLVGPAMTRIYESILKGLIPDILMVSYGTMPGMWAMVTERDFDDAMEYVFNGREAQYPELIERLNRYHENVRTKIPEILNECRNDGIEVGVVCKYGYTFPPIYDEWDWLGDNSSTVYDTSFGCTAAKVNAKLTDEYIKGQEDKGLGKYISPDKMIDASTCLFPDSTWFIGSMRHEEFPDWIDQLMQDFFKTEHMTVETDPQRPQFLRFNEDDGSILPMTEENSEGSVHFDNEADFTGALDKFIANLKGILAKIVAFFQSIIDGIVGHAKGTVAPV